MVFHRSWLKATWTVRPPSAARVAASALRLQRRRLSHVRHLVCRPFRYTRSLAHQVPEAGDAAHHRFEHLYGRPSRSGSSHPAASPSRGPTQSRAGGPPPRSRCPSRPTTPPPSLLCRAALVFRPLLLRDIGARIGAPYAHQSARAHRCDGPRCKSDAERRANHHCPALQTIITTYLLSMCDAPVRRSRKADRGDACET